MCQLLGVSSNKPVNIDFSLKEFKERGRSNPHGFGFSFYEEKNKDPILIKEPSSLFNQNIELEQFKFKSKIIIGHVRLASCGEISRHNTHPFKRNKWSFAHNGTVTKIKNNTLKKFHPEGETDSEYAFCYLLDRIYNEKKFVDIVNILKLEASKISKLGKFNFLLSDSENLFAFGDTALFFTERKSPFQSVTLKDTEYSLHLQEIKSPDERAIIIATEPITIEEKWNQIQGLTIFKDGKIINI